jgi:hypothetical protein
MQRKSYPCVAFTNFSSQLGKPIQLKVPNIGFAPPSGFFKTSEIPLPTIWGLTCGVCLGKANEVSLRMPWVKELSLTRCQKIDTSPVIPQA